MISNEQYTNYLSPLEKKSMSSYPNILTPPSSSEDSPQSVYLVASPNSNTFEYENNYDFPQMQSHASVVLNPNIEPSIMIDPNVIKSDTHPKPSLHFIEQPTDRFRFRYKSEMAGTHGSLTGINSDKSRKPTYPTVEVRNCEGRVIVRCSIYQEKSEGKDFLPHAHRLIMKKGKEELDDPHDMEIGPEDGHIALFQGMGIIHTAKKNIVSELLRKKLQLKREFVARTEGQVRELTQKEQLEIKGLAESESKSINLNIVCLRFDAFIKDNGILYRICEPIFSHGINNLKSALTGDLKIVRLDHVVSPAKGNKEIFILVERVTKKNIKIRFFELDDDDTVVWEDWGKFNDLDVHHQYAIVFKTPKYRDENITKPVHVYIQLIRPSDGARSEPRDFRYVPNKPIYKPGQKRPRYEYSSSMSYENSDMGSEELPVPINNLHIEPNETVYENSPFHNAPSGLSDEIKKAINNIDSDEFKRIFSENIAEFTSICDNIDVEFTQSQSIATDSAQKKPIKKIDVMIPRGEEHILKMEVTREEKIMATKVIDQLRGLIRTKHNADVGAQMLKYYFGEDGKTNALHVSICQKDNNTAMLLLKILAYYKQFSFLEKSNSQKQTPLHLAVLCFNEPIVRSLLLCRARVGTTDTDLNTALHLAIKSDVHIEILDLLLRNRECEKIQDYIDLENEQGNTALVCAVEKKKLAAVKLLCVKGANVNAIHPKNGFVPLRIAIEKRCTYIIKYFLSLSRLNVNTKDFQNVSPLLAAFAKDMDEDIIQIINKYMKENNIVLEVKEEPEDESEDEEMQMEEEMEVKPGLPHLSPEEISKLYEGVKNFTPRCLDKVSEILDSSENWKCLAELLEIEHLVDSQIIKSDTSMSKAVLTYSIETNQDSVLMIRNFLENLDEFQAVETIDRMVLEMKKQ